MLVAPQTNIAEAMESPRVESDSRSSLSADHFDSPPDPDHYASPPDPEHDAVLEIDDDHDDYDAYPVWEASLDEEVNRRVNVLLANWISRKESFGERPSAEQQDEQSIIFTVELRHFLLESKAIGNSYSKGKGKTRTPSQFRSLPHGKGMNLETMGLGAGKGKVRPGKGYDETHQDYSPSFADVQGSESNAGGATFRHRALRDTSGNYYPITAYFQSHPVHHNASSSHDDIFGHSLGSLGVLPVRDMWAPVAEGNRLAEFYMNATTSDDMPRGVALSRAAEIFHTVIEKLAAPALTATENNPTTASSDRD